MLLNMDCSGKRMLRNSQQQATQQFLSADFQQSVHIHHTSLNLDDDSRVFGGSQGKLLMVAEGFGPTSSGTRASTVAVDAVTQYLLNAFRIADQASVGDRLFETKLRAALDHCQKILHREGDVIDAHHGMGAEVTAAYILWPDLYLVQVGRTSGYLWRDGSLHNFGQSKQTAVVGGDSDELVPGFSQTKLRIGDRLMICSQSLRDSIDDFTISNHLSGTGKAEEICDRLVATASDNGCGECTSVVACFDKGAASDYGSEKAVDSADSTESADIQPPAKLPVAATSDDGADRGAARPA